MAETTPGATPFPTHDRPAAGTPPGASGGSERPALQRVADAAAPLLERARQAAGELRSTEQAWVDSSRACVREHPITSVVVAFTAGLLAARLLR